MTLEELAARCEAADAGEQWALLELAYQTMNGETWQAAVYRHGAFGTEPDYTKGDAARRFHAMLDAGAYESAAMMLVPEGYHPNMSGGDPEADDPSVCIELHPNARRPDTWRVKRGDALTPALALTAACLRAKGSTQ